MAKATSTAQEDRALAVSSLLRTLSSHQRILNCVPSLNREDDWSIDTAIDARVLDADASVPESVDLRTDWWTIRDQEDTGACVGFATADGVLRYHLVRAGLIQRDQLTSPRFIWMANKEMDEITDYPTTFVESAGTQTKLALLFAVRYGCVLERDLPMKDGTLWKGSTAALYSQAARLRIDSFYNLGTDLADWRRWLANKGPILTRLSVDNAFMAARNETSSHLEHYDSESAQGGHAVSIVGYGPGYFIIRNSWGTRWGDRGFAYASDAYAQEAFTEAYGAALEKRHIGGPPLTAIPPRWDTHADVLTEPRFEGITFELADGEGEPSTRAAVVARKVLGSLDRWRIEPVHPSEPMSFDLLTLQGLEGSVTVADAWNITHALRGRNDVADAEPSFVIFQDNDPNLLIPGSAQIGITEADGGLSREDLDAVGLPDVNPAWRDWSPLFVRAHEAWNVPPRSGSADFEDGKSRGEGVRIGHPDSGYRAHKELWNSAVEPRRRVLKELDHDFVDNDMEPLTDDGRHGLATASVIMSFEPSIAGPSPYDEITGVAPRADIVPMRVAKVRPVIPTPVLLRSGMIRLRKAIDYGVDEAGCQVFSISLGWLPNRSLHRAIQRAVNDHNAIVVAAAGNHVRVVVWPAHYRETLCIAACNHRGGKWSGSSRGSRVDVTAPGEDVWKADVDTLDGTKRSSGTSYSAASVAGLAALWLGHWGREYLLNKYPGIPLSEVFRLVLKRSSVRPAGWNVRKWGAGIVDARALLETALPERSQVRNAMRRKSATDEKVDATYFPTLMGAFEDLTPDELEARLSRLTGQADMAQLSGMDDEVAFHVLTSPLLRNTLAADTDQFTDGIGTSAREFRGLAGMSNALRVKIGG